MPEYEINIPSFLAKNYWLNGNLSLVSYTKNVDDYRIRNHEIDELFKAYESTPNTYFVEPVEVFCSNVSACIYVNDKNVLYVDGNHLSYYGAMLLVDQIDKNSCNI